MKAKKAISLILALVMALSCMSLSAFAEYTVTEGSTSVSNLTDLQAALADSNVTGTITLTQQINVGDNTVTIDLNGKTVDISAIDTYGGAFYVRLGNLTITDTSANGSGKIIGGTNRASKGSYAAIEVYGHTGTPASLTLSNITIEVSNFDDVIDIYGLGSYSITNCSITGTNCGDHVIEVMEGKGAVGAGSPVLTLSGTTTIRKIGGEYDSALEINDNASGTIAGSSVTISTDTGDAIRVLSKDPDFSALTIAGGTFTGPIEPGNNATITIQGGTFNPIESDGVVIDASSSDTQFIISGGTFNGAFSSVYGQISISGGKFVDDPRAYVVGGKQVYLDDENYFVVCDQVPDGETNLIGVKINEADYWWDGDTSTDFPYDAVSTLYNGLTFGGLSNNEYLCLTSDLNLYRDAVFGENFITRNGGTLYLYLNRTSYANSTAAAHTLTTNGYHVIIPQTNVSIATDIAADELFGAPAGYKVVKTACNSKPGFNYLYSIEEASYAAQIGETQYETLAEAITAAGTTAGATIMLLSNVDENATIAANQNIILDLAGNTINGKTVANAAAITNNGTLEIKDTVGGGTVKREDTGASAYYTIYNHGTMTITKAVVTNGSGYNGSGASLISNEGANALLTIDNLEFTQGNFLVIKNDTGELVINGGTFTSNDLHQGTDSNYYITSVVQNWDRATINGGIFNGGISTMSYTDFDSKTTINGGTFNGTFWTRDYSGTRTAALEIKGGTFTGSNWVESYVNPAKVSVAISGGTFSVNPSSITLNTQKTGTQSGVRNYVALGYSATGEGPWTVGKAAVTVTTSDSTTNESLEKAIAAAATTEQAAQNATTITVSAATAIGDDGASQVAVPAAASVTVEKKESKANTGASSTTTAVQEVTITDTNNSNATTTAYVLSSTADEITKTAAILEQQVIKHETVQAPEADKQKVSDFVDVVSVLTNAVAENDIDASKVTEMELKLSKTETTDTTDIDSGATALISAIEASISDSTKKVFELHPVATITTTDSGTTTTQTYDVQNSELAAGAEFTTTLDFGSSNANKIVTLTHYGSDGAVKKTWQEITDSQGKVTITLTSFSYVAGEVANGSVSHGGYLQTTNADIRSSLLWNVYFHIEDYNSLVSPRIVVSSAYDTEINNVSYTMTYDSTRNAYKITVPIRPRLINQEVGFTLVDNNGTYSLTLGSSGTTEYVSVPYSFNQYLTLIEGGEDASVVAGLRAYRDVLLARWPVD